MRIFFIGTFTDISLHRETYEYILGRIKKIGHKVDSDLYYLTSEEQLDGLEDKKDSINFQKKIIEGIKKCDVLVMDITVQRVSSGYWISLALDLNKPVVALSKKGGKHHLLKALEVNQKFALFQYDKLADIDRELPLLLDFAAEQQDTRFNFFISSKHQNYLDWISKFKKIPRSVYLRELIETEMLKNSEYLENGVLD